MFCCKINNELCSQRSLLTECTELPWYANNFAAIRCHNYVWKFNKCTVHKEPPNWHQTTPKAQTRSTVFNQELRTKGLSEIDSHPLLMPSVVDVWVCSTPSIQHSDCTSSACASLNPWCVTGSKPSRNTLLPCCKIMLHYGLRDKRARFRLQNEL